MKGWNGFLGAALKKILNFALGQFWVAQRFQRCDEGLFCLWAFSP
jgi:hypothetical protein